MTKTIDALPLATSVNASDVLPIDQGGTTYQATVDQIRASKVRKNSTGSTYTRGRLNLIEGTNVTLIVIDDSVNDEISITITASGGGGGFSQKCAVSAGVQSIGTSGSSQNVAFGNSDAYDTDSMHDEVTNNDRIVCNTDGDYLFTAYASFATNATGSRFVGFYKNGSSSYGAQRPLAISGAPTLVSVSMIIPMVAGDYVVVKVIQDSGGALNLNSCYCAVQRVN